MATPLLYVPVQGTHGWSDSDSKNKMWWQEGSAFVEYLKVRDCYLLNPNDPFLWSTDLNGHQGWLRWFGDGRKDHRDWMAGAAALRFYFGDQLGYACPVPYKHRNIITHSHGLQVVLYACARGLKIRRLVSIGSPLRKDMRLTMGKARPNIGYWVHVHDEKWDAFQVGGSLGDGGIGYDRASGLADMNVPVASLDHSCIVDKPKCFHIWDEKLLELLREDV